MSAHPPFRPPWWLKHAHAQTVYGSLFAPKPHVPYTRERWTTPDGDFVDIDHIGQANAGRAPSLLHFHGLEGSSQSGYARTLMAAAAARGWHGAVYHWRGCSGEPNHKLRAYHSGDTAEIAWAVSELTRRYRPQSLYTVGVSLGGNALLKWLGEQSDAAKHQVARAAAICAPVDLAAGGASLERGFSRLYGRHFLNTLRGKALAKIDAHPDWAKPETAAAIRRAQSLREFDNHFTAPVHGFRDTADYWARASAKPWLSRVAVPTLLLNPLDDPFLPPEYLPQPHEVSAAVTCDFPAHGGHVGFVGGRFPGNIRWLASRVFHFFDHTP